MCGSQNIHSNIAFRSVHTSNLLPYLKPLLGIDTQTNQLTSFGIFYIGVTFKDIWIFCLYFPYIYINIYVCLHIYIYICILCWMYVLVSPDGKRFCVCIVRASVFKDGLKIFTVKFSFCCIHDVWKVLSHLPVHMTWSQKLQKAFFFNTVPWMHCSCYHG